MSIIRPLIFCKEIAVGKISGARLAFASLGLAIRTFHLRLHSILRRRLPVRLSSMMSSILEDSMTTKKNTVRSETVEISSSYVSFSYA